MQGSDRDDNPASEHARGGAVLMGSSSFFNGNDTLVSRGSPPRGGSRDAPADSRRAHDPSAEGPLSLRRQGGALIITIEREERRNALSLATLEAFGNVFRHHLTPDDRAVIVTGSGARAFCAGADLKERRDMSLDEVRAQLVRYRTDLAWLSTSPVPTIGGSPRCPAVMSRRLAPWVSKPRPMMIRLSLRCRIRYVPIAKSVAAAPARVTVMRGRS